MKKCLSCKHSYFTNDGKIDRLICECDKTPDKNTSICESYTEDEEFLETLSLSTKDR